MTGPRPARPGAPVGRLESAGDEPGQRAGAERLAGLAGHVELDPVEHGLQIAPGLEPVVTVERDRAQDDRLQRGSTGCGPKERVQRRRERGEAGHHAGRARARARAGSRCAMPVARCWSAPATATSSCLARPGSARRARAAGSRSWPGSRRRRPPCAPASARGSPRAAPRRPPRRSRRRTPRTAGHFCSVAGQ